MQKIVLMASITKYATLSINATDEQFQKLHKEDADPEQILGIKAFEDVQELAEKQHTADYHYQIGDTNYRMIREWSGNEWQELENHGCVPDPICQS